MSSSISLARRSAALRSANPVDSRNSRPLIIFRKYQMPPRFRKAILLPLSHPAIERITIKANPPAIPDEGQLASVDPVVDRMTCHAEVLRGRPHIEPLRLDLGSWRTISRFHGIPPVLWPRVLVSGGPTKRESRFRRQKRKVLVALGFSDPERRSNHFGS